MENLSRVTVAIFDAIGFIWKNRKAFIIRVAPIAAALFCLDLVMWFCFSQLLYARPFIDPFIYAIFVVSWHRYTVLPKEQASTDLPWRFGGREIKFAVTTLIITTLGGLLFGAMKANLPQVIIIPIAILALIWIIISLIFVFPAIALEQPIRQMLFFKKGIRLFPSLLIAVALWLIAAFVVTKPIYFAFSYLLKLAGPGLDLIISFLVHNFIEMPLLLAIAASTASLLFKDVIGLKEDQQPEPPEAQSPA